MNDVLSDVARSAHTYFKTLFKYLPGGVSKTYKKICFTHILTCYGFSLSFSFFQNNLQLHKINEDDAAVSLLACLCLPLAVQEEKNHVFIEVRNLLEV